MLTQIYRLCFVLFAIALIGCNGYTTKVQKEIAKEGKKEPGFYEQWLYMKSNGTGVLPSVNLSLWLNNSAKRSNSNALVSVAEIGPSNIGGRTRAVICDILNSNRLLCGGISGGIFESTNKGASWQPINDHQLTPSVTGMSQNPFLPNVIYYCTGEGSGNSADIGGAGVFKSTDGGKTFSQLPSTNNSNFTTCWAIRCSITDTNVVYVSTDSKGLYKSTDAGNTFTKVYNTSAEINDIEVFANGSIMIAVKGGGVLSSATGNLGTFTAVSGIVSSGTARGEIAYCKKYPNVVYAAISGPDNSYLGVLNAFYKSSDGGKTFKTTGNPNGTVNFGFTWYCMTMAVNDNDSNKIYIAAVDNGYSTNGGQTWKKATDIHADHHVALNLPNNELLDGCDGGIAVYSWNDFNNFTSLNNGLNITQFYAGDVSPHTGLVMGGCQDNGSNENNVNDFTFNRFYGGDGGYAFYHSDFEELKYYATQNGAVYRSDNGANISNNLPNSTDAKWFIHPYDVNTANGEIIVYPANRNIYVSNNGGFNFSTLHTTTLSSARYFASTSSLNRNPAVYVGGQRSLIGIDSIENVTPKKYELNAYLPGIIKGGFVSSIKVIPGTKNELYVSLSNIADSGRVYRIQNALSNKPKFKNISGNLPQGLPVNWVECDPVNPYKTIFAGTDFGLYVTEDSGTTWIKDTRVPSTVISSIKIHANKKDIYFFTHGRGVFKGVINNNVVSVASIVNQNKPKIFPIPATSVLNIQFKDILNNANYVIYDINGKIMDKGLLSANKTVLNIEKLSIGKYILFYNNGNIKGSELFLKF